MEIAAAAGSAALVQAWGVAPSDELRLAGEAMALDGAWLWAIPGARLVVVVEGADPPAAARTLCEQVRAASGSVAVSAATPAWKALESPPDPLWQDWTAAIERSLGMAAHAAREVTS